MPTAQVRAFAMGQCRLGELKAQRCSNVQTDEAMLSITARAGGALQHVYRFLMLPGSVLMMVEICLPFLYRL